MRRIEKKRRAKRLRLARNIALGLTGIFGLASMRAEAATTITVTEAETASTRAYPWDYVANGNAYYYDYNSSSRYLIVGDTINTSVKLDDAAGAQSGFTSIMTGGTLDRLIGGYTYDGSAVYGNKVNMSGGTSMGYVVGGWSDIKGDAAAGEVYNTEVTISGDSTVYNNLVVGGNTKSGAAHDNTVTVSGTARVEAEIHGGRSTSDGNDVKTNTVNIQGSAEFTQAYGGYSNGYQRGFREQGEYIRHARDHHRRVQESPGLRRLQHLRRKHAE